MAVPVAIAAEGIGIMPVRPAIRLADAVGAGLEGNPVEGAQAHADVQAGTSRADARDDLAQEAGAVLEAAAIAPRPVDRGQEFVPQIAVTVLDVDEVEARLLTRAAAAITKSLDQIVDLVVGHQRVVVRQVVFRVEQRMVIEDLRLQLRGCSGGRSARNGSAASRSADRRRCRSVRDASSPAVRAGRRIAPTVSLVDHQLVGIGAAIVADGDRFAAPDQLCAAAAEVLPAPPHQIGRLTIAAAVPAFHRQDAEAVAERFAVNPVGLRQRRIRRRPRSFFVKRDVRADFCEMGAEMRRRCEAGRPGDSSSCSLHQTSAFVSLPNRSAMSRRIGNVASAGASGEFGCVASDSIQPRSFRNCAALCL